MYLHMYMYVCVYIYTHNRLGFPLWLSGRQSACSAGETGDMDLVPGLEDSLEKEMATYSSILAWKIPQREEPGGLQSIVLQRVKYD